MSVGVRPMRPGQEDAVAAMLKQLPRDLGLDVVPKVSGEALRKASGVANVMVAEDSGLLLGCCLWVITYSSWRGCKGIYVSDLYVMDHARGRNVGDKLLRGVAREGAAAGAQFIKLEVDQSNVKARGFYERRGFHHKPDDQLLIMESEDFNTFVKGT